jgi:hypothetical protein
VIQAVAFSAGGSPGAAIAQVGAMAPGCLWQ